ncbi:MAG: hypothetical protein V3S01_05605 [Dehalococcoidia bacterium]
MADMERCACRRCDQAPGAIYLDVPLCDRHWFMANKEAGDAHLLTWLVRKVKAMYRGAVQRKLTKMAREGKLEVAL